MHKFLGTLLAVVVLASSAAAQDSFDGTLRIAGSTTLLPVVAEASSQFMEKYGTWDKVDPSLPSKPILVQMRDAAGGSTEILQKEILREKTFAPDAIQVPSQGANIKKLESNASAIGYLSSVVAMQDEKLKVFSYEGVSPTNANVTNGTYPVTRPLLLVVKGTPSPAAAAFIAFLLGEGQKIMAEHGYVPVKAQ